MADATNFGQALDAALAKKNKKGAVEATQAVFREIADDGSLDDVVERAVKQIWEKDTDNRPFAFYTTFFRGKVLGLSNKEREFFDKKIEDSRDAVIQALNGLGEELKKMSTEDIKKSIEAIQTNMTSIDERVTENTTAHNNLKTEYDSFKKTTNEFKDNINPRIENAETELENQTELIKVYHDLAFSNAEELETIDGRIDQSGNKLVAYINDENAKLRKLHSEQDRNLINTVNYNADLQKSLRNDFDEFTTEFKDAIIPDIAEKIEMISQKVNDATQRNTTTNTSQSLKIQELSATIDRLKGQFDPDDVPPKIAELEAKIKALEESQLENDRKFTKADTNFKKLKNNVAEIKKASEAGNNQNKTAIGNLQATQQQYEIQQGQIKGVFNRLLDAFESQVSTVNIDLDQKFQQFQSRQSTQFKDYVRDAIKRRNLIVRMKAPINNVDVEGVRKLIVSEGNILDKDDYNELLDESRRIIRGGKDSTAIRKIEEMLAEKKETVGGPSFPAFRD